MNPLITRFLFRIFFLIGVVFGLHLFILDFKELPLFENKIVLAYILNTSLAILGYVILFLLRKKFKNKIGFLFVAGSMLKFLLFFLLFYGAYRADGDISRVEFFAFFVPYALTLIIEVFSLSKWLNKME